jgi:transposase
MQKVQQRPASTFVNIAGNTCATDVFAIHACDDRCAIGVIATRRDRPKAAGVDSESQILAIKKFSWSQRLRLIGARQNPIFGRIAASDSQAVFPP